MLKMNEVLKASKTNRFPDYWTLLWGRKLSASMIKTLTGALPITFRSNGTALINYRIYGTAEGAGVQTENLVEGVIERANINENGAIVSNTSFNMYVAKIAEGQEYTITTYSGFVYGFFTSFPAIGSQSYDRNRIIGQRTFIAPIDGYIAFRSAPSGTTVMLTKGSTPPETYIPYGYKLPLTVTNGTESKDTDIFIGDSKLGAEEYVDYESGKIYKLADNLLDKDAPYTPDRFLTNDGAENRGTDWGISDYIAIDGGMSYTAYNLIGNRTACCWYDENYEYISGERYRDETEKTFNLPSNARYVRITFKQTDPSNRDTLMFIPSDVPYINPTDPPLPFPVLETFEGTNTLDSSETLGEVTIKGMIKEA